MQPPEFFHAVVAFFAHHHHKHHSAPSLHRLGHLLQSVTHGPAGKIHYTGAGVLWTVILAVTVILVAWLLFGGKSRSARS